MVRAYAGLQTKDKEKSVYTVSAPPTQLTLPKSITRSGIKKNRHAQTNTQQQTLNL